MSNFDLTKYLAEGKLFEEEYNLPDSDSTTDQYVNNHWDGILKDILRAHTDLRNSKGGESIPERPSQLDIDIVLGRFDGADEFMDVDPNVYDEYFDFYDMYLVTQRDEENTKPISDEDYPKGNYDGYTKRDDLPKLDEGRILKEVMDEEQISPDPLYDMGYSAGEKAVMALSTELFNQPYFDQYADGFIKGFQDNVRASQDYAANSVAEGRLFKEDYKNDIKEGVDIDQMKIEIEDVASYLEDVNKEEEVMSNVLDRHDSDPFETMGEVYAYLDGLLQKY